MGANKTRRAFSQQPRLHLRPTSLPGLTSLTDPNRAALANPRIVPHVVSLWFV